MVTALDENEIPDLKLHFRGKVRDIYGLGEQLLMVATDRISAYDVVLPTRIPDKGRVLTQLSKFREIDPRNHRVVARGRLAAECILRSKCALIGRCVDVRRLARTR